MSPLAVLTHNNSFELFEVGQSTSVELEYLAEGGSNAQLIALSDSDANVYQGISGNGLILSGESDTVSIRVEPNQEGLPLCGFNVG